MNKLLVEKSSGENINIDINGFNIGGKDKVIISGPCAVESYDSMINIAMRLKELGVNILRGGAFKPRTSPYDFQGLEEEGLNILKQVSKKVSMPVSTEIMDTRDVEKALDYIQIIQIGSRNMYNYSLLKEVGKTGIPVILKRGISATIREWLYAAEYIMSQGNEKIILCERGIRTFETYTRNTIDINAIAYIKKKYRLPVILDPSHGTGLRELVYPVSLAGIAAGADGLIIESHICPEESISDARQTISMEELKKIICSVKKINNVL